MRIVDTNDPEDMADAEREAQARERAWQAYGQYWDWERDGKSDFFKWIANFRFYHCNPASEYVFLQRHPALVLRINRLIELVAPYNTHPWYEGWYLNLNEQATKLCFYFVTDQDEMASLRDFKRFQAQTENLPPILDAQDYLTLVRENYVPRPTPKWMKRILGEDE